MLQWARPIFIENRCTLKGSTVLATCQLSRHTHTHTKREKHACVEMEGRGTEGAETASLLAGNVEMWAMRAVNYQT